MMMKELEQEQQREKKKPKEQKKKLRYGNKIIEYNVIKSKRVKTSEITVEDDKVIIRTPLDKPMSEIKKVIKEKASWILKKQQEHKRVIPEIIKPIFEQDSTLPYLGKNYPLRIVRTEKDDYLKGNKIELINGEFSIYLPTSEYPSSAKQIKISYEGWLMDKANALFEDRVKYYSRKLELEKQQRHIPSRIIIKNQKSRWGSLAKGNVINLNVNMLKAPIDVIDYVVLHELCHLKIKEHSHRFWDYLNKFMPNYQDKAEWLKVNGISLV